MPSPYDINMPPMAIVNTMPVVLAYPDSPSSLSITTLAETIIEAIDNMKWRVKDGNI